MIKDLISADIVATDLPEDTRIWVVHPIDDPGSVVLVPDARDRKGVLWMFLKQEDAEHFAFLLSQLAPAFKDGDLTIKDLLLHDVIKHAIQDQQPIALVPPNKAMEFFKEYEELLPNYYQP